MMPSDRPPHLRAAAPVDHHGGVDVAEHAGLHQAAPCRRRPPRRACRSPGCGPRTARRRARPRARRRRRCRRSRSRCGRRRGRSRQRVVLGHDRDGRARARARDGGPERRRQAADAALDRAPCFSRNSVEPAVRLLLLEAELGIVVDLVSDSASRSSASRSTASATRCLARRAAGAAHRHRSAANSSLGSLDRAGSARRSKVVMAIALAAASMPARASGLTAAASNAREWIGACRRARSSSAAGSSGSPGSRCRRRRSRAGRRAAAPRRCPARVRLARRASSRAWLRFIGS